MEDSIMPSLDKAEVEVMTTELRSMMSLMRNNGWRELSMNSNGEIQLIDADESDTSWNIDVKEREIQEAYWKELEGAIIQLKVRVEMTGQNREMQRQIDEILSYCRRRGRLGSDFNLT
jgi:hypothetical protein